MSSTSGYGRGKKRDNKPTTLRKPGVFRDIKNDVSQDDEKPELPVNVTNEIEQERLEQGFIYFLEHRNICVYALYRKSCKYITTNLTNVCINRLRPILLSKLAISVNSLDFTIVLNTSCLILQ